MTLKNPVKVNKCSFTQKCEFHIYAKHPRKRYDRFHQILRPAKYYKVLERKKISYQPQPAPQQNCQSFLQQTVDQETKTAIPVIAPIST